MRMRFVVMLFVLLCSLNIHAQYNCTVMSSTKQTVTFRVIGYGKNVKTAMADAELSAIKTSCFIGAPGTSFSRPLVTDNRDVAESKNKDFFETFYESGYKDYIETSTLVTPFGKDAEKRKCLTMDICIRTEQLRSYLEKNGIVRKFGL
jgi:hypothetical protein